MATLLNVPVTTAVTTLLSPTFQLRGGSRGIGNLTMLLQGTFTYGSGGTTADAWVQTSADSGGTWIDIANFHFLLANARTLLNASSLTAIAATYVATDGTLAANTTKDGVLGSMYRVKYTTTGTYAGGTILRVDAIANGLTSL